MKACMIGLVGMVVLMAGCRSGRPIRAFNEKAFEGLITFADNGYNRTALDFALTDSKGNPVAIHHPSQVEAIWEGAYDPGEEFRLQQLSANCQALRLYETSRPANKSFFPKKYSGKFVKRMPALAAVALDEEDWARRQDLTLVEYESVLAYDHAGVDSVEVLTAGEERSYITLARGDFTEDGVEDWLVRLDWKATVGGTRGVELFLLEKPGKDAPIEVAGWLGSER